MGKQTERRGCRLVLVPCPYQGHINPMLQLGAILHSKGFSITIAHPDYNSPNSQNHPDFCFLSLPSGLTDREVVLGDLLRDLLAVNNNCKEHLQQFLEQHEKGNENEIACIISDELMFFCEELATNLKLPSIILRTTNAATSFARSVLVRLKTEGRIPSQDSLLHELVPELHPLSVGSIASLSEKEVAEIAWGLANSNQPFLWVIRPGSIRRSDWIELLPRGFEEAVGERGCIVKWAPQMEVLAHEAVGGFWSHCGWNSSLESIANGVPLICKPCFSDQRVNARYLTYVWNVGLELEELKREDIERVVRRLLLEDEGKEMRARTQELKEKFEDCTREGGSSYNSLCELVSFIMSL